MGFGVAAGLGLLFDIPNVFMFLPSGLFFLSQMVSLKSEKNTYALSIRPMIIVLLITLLPFLAMYAAYNRATLGSPTTLAQFVGRTDFFDTPEQKAQHLKDEQEKDPWDSSLPFKSRLQLQGFTVLLVSEERSWIYFSPILLFSLFGFFKAYHEEKNKQLIRLLVSATAVNILIYSMFGDPWGGWSFGPRYLLPSAAFMTIGLGWTIYYARSYVLACLVLITVTMYSLWINTAGALTSAAVPPKQEAEYLNEPIAYTTDYAFEMLDKNKSGSYVFNSHFNKFMTAHEFHEYVFMLEILIVLSLYSLVYVSERNT